MNDNEFKQIPDFPEYEINTLGVVRNIDTKKISKPHLTFRGYEKHHLRSPNGKFKAPLTHRLLMNTFKPNADANILTIDHVDGNKLKNSLTNLEWVTARENIHRAALQGKYGHNHITPIETYNPYTKVITHYNSMSECKDALELGRSSLKYRLLKGEHHVFPEGLQYRVATNGSTWKTPNENPDYAIRDNGTSKQCMLLDVFTNEVMHFSQLQELAQYLHCSPAYISKLMREAKSQPIVLGGYLFKLASDPAPWRPCEYWVELSQRHSLYKVTEVYDENTKTLYRFETIAKAAKLYNLKPTTLNERLNSRGKIVYHDGTRWARFPLLSKLLNEPPESNFRQISL